MEHARSFIRGITSTLALTSPNDSSDDEATNCVTDEEFIKNGQRGIVVLSAYCVKTDTTKVFHLHLYSGQICQYVEKRRKIIMCSDIQSITDRSDHNVIVEIKKKLDVNTRQKRFIFVTEQQQNKFRQYVEFRNEFGSIIRQAFDMIDRKGAKIIIPSTLKAAMKATDIHATDDDITNMLKVNGANGQIVDFDDFFHLFMDTHVNNVRDCLLEWLQLSRAQSEDGGEGKDSALVGASGSAYLDTMPGEILANVAERVRWCIISSKGAGNHQATFPGVMYTTNYRVVLTSKRIIDDTTDHFRYEFPSFFRSTTIPLCCIQKITIIPPRNTISILTKDYRSVRITLSQPDQVTARAEGLVDMLQRMAYFNHSGSAGQLAGSHLFAFRYKGVFQSNGWAFADMQREYARQGLTDEAKWQIVNNSTWSVVDTYPSQFIVPAAMTPSDLNTAIAFRSRRRVPAVTYKHASTDAVLTRSAQPMVGLAMKICKEDSKLLDLYRLKGIPFDPRELEHPSKFYILDARRQIAATLNMAQGKGTEDVTSYTNTELIFCNIDNIHVMRTSAQSFGDALLPQDVITSTDATNGAEATNNTNWGFYNKLEESGWLNHVRLVLVASVVAAEKLHLEGASVLVHCSDGWDRTAQICCCAQILLDPYYRTLEGFAVLLEKDWCSFGHKFQDRCGHGEDPSHYPDERSPVFLQFLDSVYQVMSQFPTAFEYNDLMLTYVADHVNSGLFGNFLGNSDKQRRQDLQVQDCTKSIWAYVFHNKDNFVSKRYAAYERPLWPCCHLSKIKIWGRYFSRWDPDCHPNRLTNEEWHDDWGHGLETDSRSCLSTAYGFVKAPAPAQGNSSLSSSSSASSSSASASSPTTHTSARYGTRITEAVSTASLPASAPSSWADRRPSDTTAKTHTHPHTHNKPTDNLNIAEL